MMSVNARAEAEACLYFTDPKDQAHCYEVVLGKERAKQFIDAADQERARKNSPIPDIATPTKVDNNWKVEIRKSKLDDSEEVVVSSFSKERIPGPYGGSHYINMFVRCSEGTAVVYFTFADHFMASDPGGWIDYRIDRRKASEIGLEESSDHMALGLWESSKTVRFLNLLMSAKNLYIRAQPYNESPVEGDFDVSGLGSALIPLAKACKL